MSQPVAPPACWAKAASRPVGGRRANSTSTAQEVTSRATPHQHDPDHETLPEIAIEKFTLAELDEEEQSMERLRRWRRELSVRDVFGAPSAGAAQSRFTECASRLEDYTERVFQALNPGSGSSSAVTDSTSATSSLGT